MNKWVWMAVLFGIAGNMEASMIAGWEVSGVDIDDSRGGVTNLPPYRFPSTTNVTGGILAQMNLGSGVNPSTSKDQYGFKISSSEQGTSLQQAIAASHYLEIELQIESGYRLNLDRIEMHGDATSTGCSNVVFMTSIDGFSDGDQVATAPVPVNDGAGRLDTDGSGFGAPIDLGAARYQNLSGSVSFRLYGWNSVSGSGTTRIRNLSGIDFAVFGAVESFERNGPELALDYTNGTHRVTAVFTVPQQKDFVLQYREELNSSNGWTAVSAPFSSNTNWPVATTNSTGFYRSYAE